MDICRTILYGALASISGFTKRLSTTSTLQTTTNVLLRLIDGPLESNNGIRRLHRDPRPRLACMARLAHWSQSVQQMGCRLRLQLPPHRRGLQSRNDVYLLQVPAVGHGTRQHWAGADNHIDRSHALRQFDHSEHPEFEELLVGIHEPGCFDNVRCGHHGFSRG